MVAMSDFQSTLVLIGIGGYGCTFDLWRTLVLIGIRCSRGVCAYIVGLDNVTIDTIVSMMVSLELKRNKFRLEFK